MQKFFKVVALLGGLSVASCSSLWNSGEDEYIVPSENDVVIDDYVIPSQSLDEDFMDTPREAATIYNKRIPPLNTLIVCRDKQCAPAELSTSREYIFNALAQLVDNNLDETALLCEANGQAHVCINPYLTVPAKVGVTPAYVYFDGVKVVDASLGKGKTSINLVLGYNLSYNGQTPTVCKPDKAMLYVKNNNNIVLNGNGFKCDMTSMGATNIRVLFAVDYIDLDYGYIGGYYSIGLSGPATGGIHSRMTGDVPVVDHVAVGISGDLLDGGIDHRAAYRTVDGPASGSLACGLDVDGVFAAGSVGQFFYDFGRAGFDFSAFCAVYRP